MRIVSLLPSATEIVYALGLGDQLLGVTYECDWPPEASAKRVVSFSNLPTGATPAEIDRLVSESVGSGGSPYRLDNEAIRAIDPDLVISQDLCRVCAVPSGDVEEALGVLGCHADVLSLDPSLLADVLDGIEVVGERTGTAERAGELVASLRRRLDAVRDAVAGRGRRRVFALEWGDPPFNGGHWVPEMIDLAGGQPVLAAYGTPSVRVAWSEIAAASPDIVVFMPCGYGLDAAVAEGRALRARPELRHVQEFYAVHSNAYFSRPGPRLVDGVELLASMLHPGTVAAPAAGRVLRLR